MAKKTKKRPTITGISQKKQPTNAKENPKQYAFPRGNQCPRCGATDTMARSTQGQVQYRQCVRAVCREKFKVIGQAVKFADAEK